MKLREKKIVAKEILVFAVLTIVIPIIYFSLDLYDKNIKKSNAETSIKIKNISAEIKIKADSLDNLQTTFNVTEAFKIEKPLGKFDENGQQKFNLNTENQISDEYGIKNEIDIKKDSLKCVSLKNQILKLNEQRKIVESQLDNNIDLKSSLKKALLIILILAYPLRFLIMSTIWSLKILNRKEGSNYIY